MTALAIIRPDPLWHESPEAKAILHRLRANPPRGVWIRTPYGHCLDEHYEYVGAEVDALEAIRQSVGADCLWLSDEHGDTTAFEQWAALGTVHDVIARALSDARNPKVRAERVLTALFGGRI